MRNFPVYETALKNECAFELVWSNPLLEKPFDFFFEVKFVTFLFGFWDNRA